MFENISPNFSAKELFLYIICLKIYHLINLTLLHSERPKLYTILALLSAIGLRQLSSEQMDPGCLYHLKLLWDLKILFIQNLKICLTGENYIYIFHFFTKTFIMRFHQNCLEQIWRDPTKYTVFEK